MRLVFKHAVKRAVEKTRPDACAAAITAVSFHDESVFD